MGISRIPNPDFVLCVDCKYRTKQKVFDKTGRGYKMKYFCDVELLDVPRPLYGQKGCELGRRRIDRND